MTSETICLDVDNNLTKLLYVYGGAILIAFETSLLMIHVIRSLPVCQPLVVDLA